MGHKSKCPGVHSEVDNYRLYHRKYNQQTNKVFSQAPRTGDFLLQKKTLGERTRESLVVFVNFLMTNYINKEFIVDTFIISFVLKCVNKKKCERGYVFRKQSNYTLEVYYSIIHFAQSYVNVRHKLLSESRKRGLNNNLRLTVHKRGYPALNDL